MVWYFLSVFVSTVLGLYFHSLLAVIIINSAILITAVFCIYRLGLTIHLVAKLIILILCLIGFNHPVYLHYLQSRWQLPTNLIKKNVTVTGKILNLPNDKGMYKSFNFQTSSFNQKPLKTVFHINWYQHPPAIQAGEIWALTLRLKPPHDLGNPGGFNYKLWLAEQGITATGYVVNRAPNKRLSANHALNFTHLRQHIQIGILQAVHDRSLAAFISALSIGSRSHLSQADWQVFQRTGTSHLVAIAGLHLGFIVGLIFWLTRKACRLYPKVLEIMPANNIASMVGIFFAGFYALLAGLSLPTQRAFVMIFVFMLGSILMREISVWTRILLAAIIVIICDPYAISGASFYLSFMAVSLLAFVVLAEMHKATRVKELIKMQWVIFVGLLPVSLFFFQQVSIVIMLANAIAIPWVGFIILPICFFACLVFLVMPHAGLLLFKLASILLKPLWLILKYFASFHSVVIALSITHVWILLLAVVGVFVMFMPRGLLPRYLGLAFLLPIFLPQLNRPEENNVWLTVLDVGQGLGTVIQTKNHTMVYDAGPAMPGGFDSGRDIILPFLSHIHVNKLSLMMISHSDNDHIGGSYAIQNALPIKQILTSVPGKFKHHSAEYCYQGQHWQWDGVQFNVLWPPKKMKYEDNNSSCVLKISGKNQTILMTGDIEKDAETALVKKYHQQLKADVLVVPHHGSSTSSTLAFVKAVDPSKVIFAVGFYNRFHFPRADVVKRYKKIDAKIYATDRDGAVIIPPAKDFLSAPD